MRGKVRTCQGWRKEDTRAIHNVVGHMLYSEPRMSSKIAWLLRYRSTSHQNRNSQPLNPCWGFVAFLLSYCWKFLSCRSHQWISHSFSQHVSLFSPNWNQSSPITTMTKKVTRDPNAPKRNQSAYLLYQNAMRDHFKAMNPGMTFGQLAKYTSAMYQEMP